MLDKKDIKPRNHWTKERCTEEALKYIDRFSFQSQAAGAYDAALRNKWLDEICGHMVQYKKLHGYWTKERCAKEALKYETTFVRIGSFIFGNRT